MSFHRRTKGRYICEKSQKMVDSNFGFSGLSDQEAGVSAERWGKNKLTASVSHNILNTLIALVKEPMILLLISAASIYFLSGEYGDGIFLLSATILVSAISLFQEQRSRNAIEKLRQYTQPKCKVIRNSVVKETDSSEIVIGDFLILEEGALIPADGLILHSNDFSVNESILTGESLSVFKDITKDDRNVYAGTTVASGLAVVKVTAIGNETSLGKIGKSLQEIESGKTPLEIQIRTFVKRMVILGTIAFIIVWVINFFHSHDIKDSLLKALTLAMSIIPEEIPVAFTTFMALGARRLMKEGIIVRQMKTVETLGSATIICTDKTGTITENRMTLARVLAYPALEVINAEQIKDEKEKSLIRLAMWASEPAPFDPMEISLHHAYSKIMEHDERFSYKIIHEYPLGGKPPMMTHLFENEKGDRIIAAKGAPEALVELSDLAESEKRKIDECVRSLANEGFRVLGVGEAFHSGDKFPETQQEFSFKFCGLVAFHDPPKQNISDVMKGFYEAGVDVRIITGDNKATTVSIAQSIGFKNAGKAISGDELMNLNDDDFSVKVRENFIFSRMFPEAKLRVVNELKKGNNIVAMTGDGVNDGPALKTAHIGIAMGRRGTEIARQSASLILAEDDLSKMLVAIGMGRRIYTNLKKAIRYIISIHIPIILTVLIPLILGWIYPNIFSPVHIIFLELIMGPTCSIIYENEPMETDAMKERPRNFTETFFEWKELAISIVQGLVITAGTLSIYRYAVAHRLPEATVRTMCFATLMSANIFLTLVNRSFKHSMISTLKYKNNLVTLIILLGIALTLTTIFISPVNTLFQFQPLDIAQLSICIVAGMASVVWYEMVKVISK